MESGAEPVADRSVRRQYTGRLTAHAEMGSDGWWWMIEREHASEAPDRSGSDYLEPVEEGDCLEVFDDQGAILWAGEIHGDTAYGWYPDWAAVLYGQQQVCGHDVHWVQKCDDPEAWAAMFFDHRPARLTKAATRQEAPESLGLTPEVLPTLPEAELQRVTPSLVYGLTRLFDGLSDAEQAILYGVPEETIRQWREHPETAHLSLAQVPRLVLAMELYRQVRNLTYDHPGEKEKWLRHAHTTLADMTPLAFIAADGNDALQHLIDALQLANARLREDWLASRAALNKGQEKGAE